MIPEWNSFINGDCMDYLKEFPDNYFSLALVDPPYGGGLGENGGCMGRWAKYHQNAETPENLGGGGAKAEILEPLRSKVRPLQGDTLRTAEGRNSQPTISSKRKGNNKQKNDYVGRCPGKRILRTTLSRLT